MGKSNPGKREWEEEKEEGKQRLGKEGETDSKSFTFSV
jgi:hypothetical protein